MTHTTFAIAFALLNIADAILTAYGIKKGGAEANPILRPLFKALGVWGGLLAYKVPLIALAWHFPIEQWAQVLLLAVTALVVGLNVRAIQKL